MKMAKEKTSRLGTGLSALFGEEENVLENETVQTLPISRVEPRKDQPRREFDPAAIEELAASIREYGLIQPITVRPLDKGYYQIIAGERRWRASRAAGLKEVPVRILEADDKLAMELALVENLQREDLNPMEEAAGYKKLMDDYGLTQEQVATRVQKSRPAVTNALRLNLFRLHEAKHDKHRQPVTLPDEFTAAPQETNTATDHKEEKTMYKTTVTVEGMMCHMCEKHVNEALSKAFAAENPVSDHTANKTEFISAEKPDEAKVKEVIEAAGYTVKAVHTETV